MVDRGWQPERDSERAKQHFTRDIGGFSVYIAEFTDGWHWNLPQERHHTEPGPKWFGPFPRNHQAEDEVREQRRKRWSWL